MKKLFINNQFILVLLLTIIFPHQNEVYGQLNNTQTMTKSGTTAAQFLKIGVDARGTGMGNAFTAMDGDISSMFWNAAGLANVKRIETMFVNYDWLAGVGFQYLGFALPIRRVGVLGFSVTSLSVPDDEVRTVADPEGTGEYWGAQDLAANLSLARKLMDCLGTIFSY